MILQAHAERQGSLVWLGFAGQGQAEDPEQKKAFLALADLELASADQVDAALGVSSTSEL
jgi:hypothetical protein